MITNAPTITSLPDALTRITLLESKLATETTLGNDLYRRIAGLELDLNKAQDLLESSNRSRRIDEAQLISLTEAIGSTKGLVRELNVLLNGDEAAGTTSLSDIVEQIGAENIRSIYHNK